MTPTADVKQLQAESRPLMTATLLAQQQLFKASQQVHDIERTLAEISAAAARTADEGQRALHNLEHRRQALLADQSLGVDVAKDIQGVDQEIAALSSSKVARDLAQTRVGLQVRLARANQELSEASKAERKKRIALLTLLEEQEAAAFELIDSQLIKHLVKIQALAQFRGAQGVDGLIGNDVLMPKASLSRNTSVVRLTAGQFRARVSEEMNRLAVQLEKSGVLVERDAIAVLQSPSVKSYVVQTPLQHNGIAYSEGDSIELPDVQAKPLIESETIRERQSSELRAELSSRQAEVMAA